MDFLINKYFGFLVTEFSFKGPYTYYYVRERHTDFVKGDLVISVASEGDYWVEFIKLKSYDANVENGTKKVIEIDPSEKRHYSIGSLDRKKKLWNSVSSNNFPDKKLWYYLNIIRQNPELLKGDFRKFTLKYRLLRFFKGK